ncbi:Death-associated protein kinase related-like [Homarus americanus]|uniref:Death-associated protein kinase related-like n=1 Tax=Homarus americanus TaxID=6706 RepID=A0A8J5MRB8_HOMAM|nr:Death-associated protein kinase related-like [Homarus americanus]
MVGREDRRIVITSLEGPEDWSLGVLTYVLLTGFLPFGGDTDQETFLEISLGELDFPEELFEDISAEAIDFIKKLLIRKPQYGDQSRMSARECLEHPWMKADLSKAKIPPQPVLKTSSSPATTSTSPATTSMTLTVPTSDTHHTSTSVHSPSLVSALSEIITSAGGADHYTKSSGSLSNTPGVLTPTNTTPAILTPNNTTPTILTPMSSSPRDIGLPPIHPLSGPKTSAVNSAYSSTSSLYRGGSRQSLDRVRSLSKSREVLFERMQMSNQKKAVSKSRERLHEGRLGLSRSREDLWALKSFSHSEEALSVFGWLNQDDDSLYKSCTNVFLPMLPMVDEYRVSGRLYKSLASIDKIDEVGTESTQGNERQSIFDSRFSINDEEYNHLITKYNTAVNSHRKTPPRGRTSENRQRNTIPEGRLKGNSQGGRGDNACNKRCSRHSHPESDLTQKVPKVSRAERMKRDVHRRRKGKKEKETMRPESPRVRQPNNESEASRHVEKPIDKSSCSSRAPSPSKRRGSVSHIEQRIQERHERQQEKLERQERQEKLERRGSGKGASGTPRRRDSGEEKTLQKEKNKNNKHRSSDENINRPRSTSPSKRTKVNKTRSNSSDASPASSLESVKELSDYKRSSPSYSQPSEGRKSSGAANDIIKHKDKRTDMDEAYVSLEEPVDDGIFSRSESMDSTNTVESDHTVRATDTSSDTIELTFASCTATDSEPKQAMEKPIQIQLSEKHELEVAKEEQTPNTETPPPQEEEEEKAATPGSIVELSAIHEEGEDERSVFARSVSTSSDIGSMMSENSEADKEDSSPSSSSTRQQETEHLAALTWKLRGRSMSMQPSDPPPFSHLHLCRSNSFNLGMPLGSFMASPWDDVCDGAISRALEMFKLNSKDLTKTAGRNFDERRPSLHSQ